MPDHLPLEAWDRSELLGALWKHQQAIKNLQREFDRRGERDEWKWGFPVFVHEKLASGAVALTTAYRIFDTPGEAYAGAKAYAIETEQDAETAPYRVHKVYLPAPESEKKYCRVTRDTDRSPEGGNPERGSVRSTRAGAEGIAMNSAPYPIPEGE